MLSYNWSCPVCDITNAADSDKCAKCGSPAFLNATEIEARRTAFMANSKKQFTCTKCGHHAFKSGEVQVAGGILGRMFEVDADRFTYVACEKCRFTEFYQGARDDILSTLELVI